MLAHAGLTTAAFTVQGLQSHSTPALPAMHTSRSSSQRETGRTERLAGVTASERATGGKISFYFSSPATLLALNGARRTRGVHGPGQLRHEQSYQMELADCAVRARM